MRLPRSRFACFAVAAVLEVASPATADVRFPGAVSLLEEPPAALVEADFDGDGDIDAAVAYPRVGGIGVLLGTGDGRFDAAQTLLSGVGVESLVVSDLDGDGILDLAALDPERGEVGFHHGTGDGSFMAPVRSPAAIGLADLHSCDVDGDGLADLVAADQAARSVAWLRGDGAGGFEAPQLADAGIEPAALAVADFDVDGWCDAAVVDVRDGVFVLFGAGSGFGPPVQIATESDAFLTVGDLDADGLPDLVTGNAKSVVRPGLVVHYGIGSRHFQDGFVDDSLAFPESVAIADLDSDGTPEIVVAGGSPEAITLAVLRSDGRGRFERIAGSSWRAFFSSARLAVADMDGDGHEDVMAGVGVFGRPEGELLVLPGNGDGTFPFADLRSAHGSPHAVAVADLDDDGLTDLIVADSARDDGDGLSVLFGLGDRSFASPTTLEVGTQEWLWSVSADDLDADGDLDLLVLAYDALESGFVKILRGHGSGAFDAPESLPLAAMPRSSAVADLDRDRAPDLVLGSDAGIHVLLGHRDGSFGPERIFQTPGGAGSIGVADFDGDRVPDLVAADATRVAVYLGNGDGTFRDGIWASQRGSVEVGNVDGDGVPDLVVALPGGIAVRLGNGDGTFGPAELVPPPFGSGRAILDDVDRDGRADLVSYTSRGGWVSVWPGLGDGRFSAGRSFRVTDLIADFAVADIDGDGASDLVATNLLQRYVSVLFQVVEPRLEVGIDIRPGDETNLIGPNAQGELPVALLGGPGFDVQRIDETSLAFGPGAAPLHGRVVYRDANGDGALDASVRFRLAEAGLDLGASEACLTGTTDDGRAFSGCDAIRFAGACGLGFEVALLLPGLLWLGRVRRGARSR